MKKCPNRNELSNEVLMCKSALNGFRPLFVYPCGGSYRGMWKMSKPHGLGVKTKNDLSYDGQWYKGKRHGYGTLVRKLPDNRSKRIYVGQWVDGLRSGEGKNFYENGVYYGWWQNNKRHGLGIMWYTDKSIYFGQWENDLHHGYGVLYCANGNRYEGHFENGMKNGKGLFYHMDTGQVQRGVWTDDICKTSIVFDDFRNQVLHPTPYPIPETLKSNQAKKLVDDYIRKYDYRSFSNPEIIRSEAGPLAQLIKSYSI